MTAHLRSPPLAKSALTALFVFALLCAPNTFALAQETCRTRCKADEVLDASGCCAPLNWESPKALPSPTKERAPSAQFTDLLRASHFSAAPSTASKSDQIAKVRALTATIKEVDVFDEDAIALLNEQVSLVWEIWLHIDQELSALATPCLRAQEGSEERALCARDISAKLAERETWGAIAAPILSLSRALSREIIVHTPGYAVLVDPLRAQSLYYELAMALSLSEEERALKLATKLVELDKRSPYTAFAAMSLADHYLETGRAERASPLYLQAIAHQHNPASAYAMYRAASCMAQEDEGAEAMRMLIHGLERLSSPHAEMVRRGELSSALMRDVITLYSQTGAPQNAPTFFVALGVPDAVVPIMLERLITQYRVQGRDDEADIIETILLDAQESGTSMPRSR